MGITKASLATESWLSAASFQETTRVLTRPPWRARATRCSASRRTSSSESSSRPEPDCPKYRNVTVEATEEAKAAVYSVGSYDDSGEYTFGTGSGEAVPLEEYDFGQYGR